MLAHAVGWGTQPWPGGHWAPLPAARVPRAALGTEGLVLSVFLTIPWFLLGAGTCWPRCAVLAVTPLLCWQHLAYQEQLLELARPQLALVPLGYSMSLLLWDPQGPGTQLPSQSIVWQVRALQGRGDSTTAPCRAPGPPS